MKHHRISVLAALFLTIAVFCPAGLFADTSALPIAAPGVQNSSVSAPLDAASSSALKAVAADVNGVVTIQRNGKAGFEALKEKSDLAQGDVVKTGEGICHIVIGGKSQIFVEPNSVLSITEALKSQSSKAESTKLSLQSGKLKISLPNLKGGSTFEVATPTAVATVRGTIFYLMVGKIQDVLSSQLYVDKSNGGVLFKNIFSGESVLVPHHSLSNSSQDGKLDAPKELTPQEQKEFINQWESLGGANQQFGVEEVPLNNPAAPPSPALLAGFADSLEKFGLKDALIDKLVSQNVVAQNQEAVLGPPAPPGLNGTNPGDTNTGTGDATGPTGSTDPVITDADKSMILDVLNQNLANQQFDTADAGAAKAEDAQTGKVFTDVHGNRVRVDQYITQTSPSSIGFLSLTLREGEYQNGITSLFIFTQFNRELTEADGPFRDLPWNDYLNVVKRDDLPGLSAGGQYEQFIVHEHYPIPAGGLDFGPDLYPAEMLAMFMTPLKAGQTDFSNFGAVIFGEQYSSPFRIGSDKGAFWIQGVEEDLVAVLHGSGESAVSIRHVTQPPSTIVNGVQSYIVDNLDHVQSAGFSSSPAIADLDTLAGINFFRGNPIHPASFENQFGPDRVLTGYFLPINDAGQVFDAPGFRLRGIRDIIHPNTLVGGGNYNLELLLVYGELSDNTISREIFRIDVIVTPEIFAGSLESGRGFGLKDENGDLVTDTRFPSTLDTSDPQAF